jgi:molybdopterin synthase sulfur carrier subunit
MIVSVKAYAAFRDVLGDVVDVELGEKATIEDLLRLLCRSNKALFEMIFDKSGGLRDDVNILKMGRHIQSLKGTETELQDGDKIAIFTPVVGG